MFRGVKNLLLVGILFYGINEGLAQEQPQGQAYEFSGLARFVIAPSQLLFRNNVWDQAGVLKGYHVKYLDKCKDILIDLTSFIVLSQEDNTRWWNQPIYNYEVIPKEQIDSVIKKDNTNDEVFILDPKEEFSKCDSDDLINKKFVVDSTIVNIVDELSTQQPKP